MVYQDNSGCDTTFYKVCNKYQWLSMSLSIHKHPKSSNMAVNLSLNSAHFIAHVGILEDEFHFLKVNRGEKKWFICVFGCKSHRHGFVNLNVLGIQFLKIAFVQIPDKRHVEKGTACNYNHLI